MKREELRERVDKPRISLRTWFILTIVVIVISVSAGVLWGTSNNQPCQDLVVSDLEYVFIDSDGDEKMDGGILVKEILSVWNNGTDPSAIYVKGLITDPFFGK